MALSTNGQVGLWTNPVYFAWDDKFNLYFVSQLDCLHMENIQADALVSCAIYPTERPVGRDVFGAYVKGKARIISDAAEKKIADDVYYGRVYPDDKNGKERDTDGYRSNPTWHFVKITLDGLWYFDTRYFEEKRVEIPDEIWR